MLYTIFVLLTVTLIPPLVCTVAANKLGWFSEGISRVKIFIGLALTFNVTLFLVIFIQAEILHLLMTPM